MRIELNVGDRVTWGGQYVACEVLAVNDEVYTVREYAYCDAAVRARHGVPCEEHDISHYEDFVYCDNQGNPIPAPPSTSTSHTNTKERTIMLRTHLTETEALTRARVSSLVKRVEQTLGTVYGDDSTFGNSHNDIRRGLEYARDYLVEVRDWITEYADIGDDEDEDLS